MARITVKYPIGKDVEHFSGVQGRVTAIFIRGSQKTYEMSYLSGDNPTCVTVEECELKSIQGKDFGFNDCRN